MKDVIKLNIEGSDKGCAFFALYAGLRMYKEQKDLQVKEEGSYSIAAAEAYSMLCQLQESHPKEYKEAEAEYIEVYIHPMRLESVFRPYIVGAYRVNDVHTLGDLVNFSAAKTRNLFKSEETKFEIAKVLITYGLTLPVC